MVLPTIESHGMEPSKTISRIMIVCIVQSIPHSIDKEYTWLHKISPLFLALQ